MMTSTVKCLTRTIAATTLGMAALSFSTVSTAQESRFASFLDGWAGTATLGLNTSTGNSEATNINGALRLGKTVGRWEHVVFGSLFKGEATLVVGDEDDNGNASRTIVRGDTSDRIALGYQPKYYFSERTYFFALLDWEQDEPANIEQRTRQVVGMGYRFFSNTSGFLSGEIGVGNNTTNVVSGDDLSGGVGFFSLNYLNRLNDNATFTADLRSDFGSENTFVELGLGLGFRVSTNVSIKLNHFTRNNSDLSNSDNPLDSSRDSVTSFQLVFDI